MRLRNWLYDRRILQSQAVPRPVVAIGNLTFGGTGKTPFVELLLRHSQEQNVEVGVISRGYGRESGGILPVQNHGDAPRMFGDEPALLKMKFPRVPILVGAKKVKVAQQLVEQFPKTQMILADDAFQHRALRRDLDIVLIDAARPLNELRCFPLGRGRESLSGLVRADFVVLTRTELASTEHLQALKAKLQGYVRTSVFERLIECKSVLGPVRTWQGQAKMNLPQQTRVMAVSAIGSPQSFENGLSAMVKVVEGLRFRDHYSYSQEDILRIETRARELECSYIVTTEKDEVKIRNLKLDADLWAVLPVAFQPSSNIERLYAQLSRLVLSRD